MKLEVSEGVMIEEAVFHLVYRLLLNSIKLLKMPRKDIRTIRKRNIP